MRTYTSSHAPLHPTLMSVYSPFFITRSPFLLLYYLADYHLLQANIYDNPLR